MRHFFFAARWEARTRREGRTWEKGDPRGSQGGRFPRKAGAAAASRLGSPELRGSRGADGGRARPVGLGLGMRGETTRSWGSGGGGGGGRLRQAAPRAQGACRRRPPGGAAGALAGLPSECRLPPREEMWGPGLGARRAWVALAGPPGPTVLPECSPRCSALHHVDGCGERPKRVHGAGCGGPEARGCVLGGPKGRGPGGGGASAGDLSPGWSGDLGTRCTGA